jgi:hypothetical protein
MVLQVSEWIHLVGRPPTTPRQSGSWAPFQLGCQRLTCTGPFSGAKGSTGLNCHQMAGTGSLRMPRFRISSNITDRIIRFRTASQGYSDQGISEIAEVCKRTVPGLPRVEEEKTGTLRLPSDRGNMEEWKSRRTIRSNRTSKSPVSPLKRGEQFEVIVHRRGVSQQFLTERPTFASAWVFKGQTKLAGQT